MSCTGSPLGIPELLALAAGAGFTGPDVVTAVAIALAESAGIPNCYNAEIKAGAAPGQGSYGLWQIYLTAHPEFDPQQLLSSPSYNASAAFQVYQQAGSFTPWTTFKYGAYLGFVGQVQAAAAASSPAPAPGDGTVTDGTTTDGAISTAAIAGDGLTNYWPLLIVGAELLFALMFARG